MGQKTPADSGLTSLYTYKNRSLPLARRQVFHYLLFASTQSAEGTGGSSGIAELEGNDFMVTLGGWGLTSLPGKSFSGEELTGEENTRILIHIQASTIMHELGHNLGLGHGGRNLGGADHTNYKPNYLSIMNYAYQISGLPGSGPGEAMRYYWSRFSQEGRSSLSPFFPYFYQVEGTDFREFAYFSKIPDNEATAEFLMDYSTASAPVLKESDLLESLGLGLKTSSPIDFNGSQTIDPQSLEEDLNVDGRKSELNDHHDWGNLLLTFQRSGSGNLNGLSRELRNLRLPVIWQDRQPVIVETTLPR